MELETRLPGEPEARAPKRRWFRFVRTPLGLDLTVGPWRWGSLVARPAHARGERSCVIEGGWLHFRWERRRGPHPLRQWGFDLRGSSAPRVSIRGNDVRSAYYANVPELITIEYTLTPVFITAARRNPLDWFKRRELGYRLHFHRQLPTPLGELTGKSRLLYCATFAEAKRKAEVWLGHRELRALLAAATRRTSPDPKDPVP